MKLARLVPWAMLAVWASWFSAAQAVVVAQGPLGRWMPDLGILLLVVLSCRLHRQDVPLAAGLLALARIAYTVEPPTAILAAFLGISVVARSTRGLAEMTQPGVRIVLGGGAVLAFSLWMSFVHALHVHEGSTWEGWRAAAALSVPVVISTSLVSLFFFESVAHLPGLTPLRRRSERW